jgi:hypothetical protein
MRQEGHIAHIKEHEMHRKFDWKPSWKKALGRWCFLQVTAKKFKGLTLYFPNLCCMLCNIIKQKV